MSKAKYTELGEAYRLGGGATVINNYVAVAFADSVDARRFCDLLREMAVPPRDKTSADMGGSVGYFQHGTGGGKRNIRKADGLS